jgi:hypothetical protein
MQAWAEFIYRFAPGASAARRAYEPTTIGALTIAFVFDLNAQTLTALEHEISERIGTGSISPGHSVEQLLHAIMRVLFSEGRHPDTTALTGVPVPVCGV